MRTTKLILALLASAAFVPCAYAQLNKHDQSIATYNYNIAIVENDVPSSTAPLNQQLDQGVISENAMPAPAASMPAAKAMPVIVPAQPVQIGAQAPDFMLSYGQGQSVNLKSVLASGPAVILFTRGSFCGFCVNQMKLLQKNQAQFNALGIRTYAVSPESAEGIAAAQQRFGITYPTFGDANSQAATAYGLSTPNGVAPALVTIDASGKIVDVQVQQPGVNAFNLTQATNPLRTQAAAAPVEPATSPATAVPTTKVAPEAQQPAAMPPVPSPQAGKVSFTLPPSHPDFGKVDTTKSIAI